MARTPEDPLKGDMAPAFRISHFNPEVFGKEGKYVQQGGHGLPQGGMVRATNLDQLMKAASGSRGFDGEVYSSGTLYHSGGQDMSRPGAFWVDGDKYMKNGGWGNKTPKKPGS